MRRWNRVLLLAPLAGAGVWAGGLWAGGTKPPAGAKPAEGPAATPLPVARVVLFTSGVGYFSRQGTVEGDARVDLQFPESDVNDLLKSLTVEDLDGGKLGAVSYDSQQPVDKILSSFAIDLSGQPPLAHILIQARGEAVELTLPAPAPTITGTIVGVENRKLPAKEPDHAVTVDFLTVLTANGLQAVNLQDVQRVKFQNPALDAELRRALEVLAKSHDSRKKAVSVRLAGQGKRRVKVGYVVEAPVWKTSYRLMLDKDGKPMLQGWAVVENTTDEDWTDVKMSLVAGRPVSFRMDLYNPLFVPRPVVEPELFASLRPPSYDGAFGEKRKAEVAQVQPPAALPAPGGMGLDAGGFGGGGIGGGIGGGGGGIGGFGGVPAKPQDAAKMRRGSGRERLELQGMNTAESNGPMSSAAVQSAATGEKLGAAFQYALDQPVSVARQKSALLPIVAQAVEAERVSIYNPAVQAKHPLLGVRFTNSTGLNLNQGPVTVFDGPAYAGDARLPDLQPKENRLLAFAIDLGMEVVAKSSGKAPLVTKVAANKGLLVVTRSLSEERSYTAVNRTPDARTLLVEHPNRTGQGYKLTAPAKATEETAELFRFALPVKAGATVELTVAEERTLDEVVQITTLGDDQLGFYLRMDKVSPALKEKLKKAAELRQAWAAVQQQVRQTATALQRITQDQDRIRRNLAQTPKEAEVYKTYLTKLSEQEKSVDRLTTTQKELEATELAARTAFERFVADLSDGAVVGTPIAATPVAP